MSRNTKEPIGWFDWQTALCMILFVVLMRCYVYYDLDILKYIAFIPAIYGVGRTFARWLD